MYNLYCTLIGKENEIYENITFDTLCNWLTTNKHNLFGYSINRGNEYWSAKYFMRYKTELEL